MSLPRVVVFDLDGTLWAPEMYEMWGGGSPFTAKENGKYLVDKKGERVNLLGDSRALLEKLIAHPAVESGETTLGLASTCDEPEWARECLNKFTLRQRDKLVPMGSVFQHHEIFKANKREHFKRIQKATGAEFADMIFFDNQTNNIHDVSPLGVHCVYTPEGQTMGYWEKGIADWRKKRGEAAPKAEL